MSEDRGSGFWVSWEYATVGGMWLATVVLLTVGTVRGSFTVENWGLAASAASAAATVALVVSHVVQKAKRCLVEAVGYQIRMNGHGENPEVTGKQVLPMQQRRNGKRVPTTTLD